MSKAKHDTSGTSGDNWKIGQVVELTDLSKELIHHYFRQGMLPPSSSRGKYDARQVHLLRLIRRLREDYHLPLEVIRGLFEAFEFDPIRIEPLVLGESLPQRIMQLTEGADLALSHSLSAEELATAAGVSVEVVTGHVEQGLVVPSIISNRGARFTPHDANVIALAEHGSALGIPYESFRTIASYVRVAFELEHRELFSVEKLAKKKVPADGSTSSGEVIGFGLKEVLTELFLRRELIASFVQANFHTMVQRFLRRILEQPAPPMTTLDRVVFRPSPAFVQHHGIRERIECLGEELSRDPDGSSSWFHAAETHIHAGRYREAVFFLEQALERWPDDENMRTHYGIASILSGEGTRGREQLEAVLESDEPPALAKIFLALSMLEESSSGEFGTHEASRVLELTRDALADSGQSHYREQVEIFGAWLLTALPSAFRHYDEGTQRLRDIVDRMRESGSEVGHLPGYHERLHVNAAYLLFECLERGEELEATAPSLEELRGVVCRVDPGSAFAREVFLKDRT